MSKFDQIKFYMLDKFGGPQVDILSINETSLKPTVLDSLYVVPGFVINSGVARVRYFSPAIRKWKSN